MFGRIRNIKIDKGTATIRSKTIFASGALKAELFGTTFLRIEFIKNEKHEEKKQKLRMPKK